MSRTTLRNSVLFVIAGALVMALWHGIYIPVRWATPWTAPLLENRSVALNMGGLVISAIPQPRIRILQAELRSTIDDTLLARAGLVTLHLAPFASADRWLTLDGLTAKEAEVWIDQTIAEGSNWAVWPRVPPRSDRAVQLPRVFQLQNTFFYIKNASIGALTAHIDQLQWVLDGTRPATLAVRLQHPHLQGNWQATGLLRADDAGWQLDDLSSEFSGRIAGYPWSLTLAAASVTNRPLQHSVSAYDKPVQAAHFRVYVRRDDDPDEHQAVFSATRARFYPADGRAFIRFAEWTYTHEKAEAWTFHADADGALGLLTIRPATIAGSEGLPAQPLTLSMRCRPSATGKAAPAVWRWEAGWFIWADEYAGATKPSAAAGVTPSSNAGGAAEPESVTGVLACQSRQSQTTGMSDH